MKEILFKAKRTDNGKWVQGFYFERKNTEGKIIESVIIEDMYQQVSNGMRYMRSDIHKDCFRVDPETVGQYTGLTDKNGTKIFEGDIAICKQDRIKDVCTIGFENGAFMAYPVNGKIYERTLWQYWNNDWDIEVIGNIHDNTEILKGGVIDE